jgi:hypothetical protein
MMCQRYPSADDGKTGESCPDPRPVSAKTPDEPLLHFGLRHLFSFVAVVSVLLAGIMSADGLTSAVMLVAAVVVSVHVFATSLGTRLRSRADAAQQWEDAEGLSEESGVFSAQRSARLADVRTAPRSPWHGRGSTVLPWLPRMIVAGAAVGGTVGAAILAITIGHRTSAAGVAVGSISLAVLGGWCAFLLGSFYGVFRHGVREAVAEQQKDELKRPVR